MSIKAIENAHGPDAAFRVIAEAHRQHADLGILPYFNRAVAAHRVKVLKRTHVVVGDHPPEPRANHDICDSGDGSTVAQCRGVACKRHGRCCWQ